MWHQQHDTAAKTFCNRILAATTIIASFSLGKLGFAQVNHTYPRTAVQHFGKAPSEWYAKFDMVLIPWTNENRLRDIKRLNPKTLIIWVDGWTSFSSSNSVTDYIPGQAPEWFAVDASGKIPSLNWGTLLDMSSLCPKVNGQRYVDRHPEVLLQQVDLSLIDGIGSDWCWGKPSGVKNLDLDRNGKNDYEEHGKNWVNARWLEGVEQFIARLRNLLGPDKLIWINSGTFHDWAWSTANGLDIERQSGFTNWNFYWDRYRDFMARARKPHILLMDVRPDWQDPIRPDNTKNHFKLNRFMLTATLLGDGYYNFSPLEAEEHHFQAYFDEFDLNLGYPTRDAQELSNGCFARFFDNGVSIVNPTGRSVTVRDSDLGGLAGYRGPYFRFQGGQDPGFNNGAEFTSVELWGGYNYKSGGDILLGDGIILLTEKKTVISDILVDNNDLDSSPGQKPAQLTGGWQSTEDGDLFWNQKSRPSDDWYPHVYTEGGNGNQLATFNINIGVTGKYEVFEWHGFVSKGRMATNVPYTIHHSDGTTKKVIDQSTRQGTLNSLGVYPFTKGSHKVVISNDANGLVVADMIMLVHQGENESSNPRDVDDSADREPPSAPRGVRAEGGKGSE